MALLPSLNAFLMFPLYFVSIFLIRARSVAIMTNLLSLVRAITISRTPKSPFLAVITGLPSFIISQSYPFLLKAK